MSTPLRPTGPPGVPAATGRPATRRSTRTPGAIRARRTARDAGLALLAAVALTVPAAPLLRADGATTSVLDVAASFLVVAGLELLVARGFYVVARERAHPTAYAALLSRAGHALLLVVAATLLAWRGPTGLDAFRDDWSTALAVLALHLVVAGVAARRARLAPNSLTVAVVLSGAVALALTVSGGAAALAPAATTLVPAAAAALVGEALLAAALLHHGLHTAAPRLVDRV